MFEYRIVYIFKTPFVKHIMLLLPSGYVIHNAPTKGIVIELLEVARDGREVFSGKIITSNMSPDYLCQRTRSMAWQRKYQMNYNCEHFLADLFGNPVVSKQLQFGVFAGLTTLLLVVCARRV